MGVYLVMARRKRLRNNPRDEWEFDLLQEDEADGLNGAGKINRKGGKRRAGELYDAFAAGSEDESDGEFSSGGDEREKRLYEDEEDDLSEAEGSGSSRSAHVVGDDDEDDDESVVEGGNEKGEAGGRLLGK